MVQKDTLIPLAKPYITEDAIKRVESVLRSGHLVQGKFVTELENALAEYLDVKHAILMSSGTMALFAALKSIGINENHEVIIPAFSFIATANVVEALGAKPVFVDITENDFNIDAAKIEKAISEKTKAIMPVHEFGQAAHIDIISKLAAKFNIPMIEDAACALGTIYKGRMTGTSGDLGCFSFHPRKIITTGEGGLAVTDNEALAHKIKLLRNHGIESTTKENKMISWGYNLRMTDIQAALGLPQLEILDDYLKNRTRLAGIYDRYLKDISGIKRPKIHMDGSHTYQTYHILINEKYNRDQIIDQLKAKNVQAGLGAQAIHLQQYYAQKYGFKKGDFPNTERAYFNGIALPIGHHIEDEQIQYIVSSLKDILNGG